MIPAGLVLADHLANILSNLILNNTYNPVLAIDKYYSVLNTVLLLVLILIYTTSDALYTQYAQQKHELLIALYGHCSVWRNSHTSTRSCFLNVDCFKL